MTDRDEAELAEDPGSDVCVDAEATGIVATSAVAEFRRIGFRYLDLKGKIAEELATRYGEVGFQVEGQLGLSLAETVAIRFEGERRRAFVNVVHAGFEEQDPSDMERLEREGFAFIRQVERILGTKSYDRVGFRFLFNVSAPDLGDITSAHFGLQVPGWTLADFHFRLLKQLEDWRVAVEVAPVVYEPETEPRYSGFLSVDVDQSRQNLPAAEAWRPEIVTAHERAISIVKELFERGD